MWGRDKNFHWWFLSCEIAKTKFYLVSFFKSPFNLTIYKLFLLRIEKNSMPYSDDEEDIYPNPDITIEYAVDMDQTEGEGRHH